MRTFEPILLTGDYDWDAGLLPLAEYAARLEAIRVALAEEDCTALVLEGDGADHASLAYVTGYAPKLNASSLALVQVEGPVQLFFFGAPPMTPAARRQTWVHDVHALRDARATVAGFVESLPVDGAIALAGSRFMGTGSQRMVFEAIGPSRRVVRMDERLGRMRRRKSSRERDVMRRTALILESAVNGFSAAYAGGAGTRTAHVAAERAAHRAGAQDVRVLASVENGGTPWPFDRQDDLRPDPCLVHISVRFAGYWAEAFFAVGRRTGAVEMAERTLDRLIGGVLPGASAGDLASDCAEYMVPFRGHPYVEGCFGHGVGLFPEEAPHVSSGGDDAFQESDVLALRVGLVGVDGDSGFASAIVAVGETGAVILWSSVRGPSAGFR
jgi:Xaa-Pro aminopeptidase